MKRTMMAVVMAVTLVLVGFFTTVQPTLAAGGGPDTNLRRMLYELNALQSVVQLQVDAFTREGTWQRSGTSGFANGRATLSIDMTPGPGLYYGQAFWKDQWGFPLFYCSDGKYVQMRPGMNWKDFPVNLYPGCLVHLRINGPVSGDSVWVNGNPASYSDGYWSAYVSQPWLVDQLVVIWSGHGGWTRSVDYSFPFGPQITLAAGDMDPNNDSVSQMSAMSYSGENSWVDDVASYQGTYYDESQQCDMVSVSTSIPNGTEALVFFTYYQDSIGTVEYYSIPVTVRNQSIAVPLHDTWFSPNYCSLRVVFTDSNGKVWQSWVSPGNGTVVVGG